MQGGRIDDTGDHRGGFRTVREELVSSWHVETFYVREVHEGAVQHRDTAHRPAVTLACSGWAVAGFSCAWRLRSGVLHPADAS